MRVAKSSEICQYYILRNEDAHSCFIKRGLFTEKIS